MKPRHVPMRTCAGCREERPKRDMVRVVRGADGSVSPDPTGKRPGRGTYVCPRPECWTRALRTGFAHSLKAEIAPGDRAELERYAGQLRSSADEKDVGLREGDTAYA